ncbi:MAG TPA: zinc-dependent metalloprotease family protein [Gemmatimonadales bacterium]|nr:zinc-dependent metalloprotease family protein [Gemmatimonadales bacterium]
MNGRHRISRLFLSGTGGRWLAVLFLVVGCGGGEAHLVSPPPSPGTINLTIAGLPNGAPAQVAVSGPGGFASSVGASQVLSGLAPGAYTVSASQVLASGDAWSAAPASQAITVTSGTTASASVSYSLSTGSINLMLTGVPTTVTPSITVTGPGGFNQAVAGTGRLATLAPGDYTLTAANLDVSGIVYTPTPEVQAVTVTASLTPAQATVSWAASSGSILVGTTGLPPGVEAALAVTGPGGFSQELTETKVLSGLTAGIYRVVASPVIHLGTTWAPNPLTQEVSVTNGATIVAAVTYAATTGSIAVTIRGLPSGVSAPVTYAGPSGVSGSVSSSQTLAGLAPGEWTFSAASVSVGADTYIPTPVSLSVTLVAGSTSSAGITYALEGASTLNLRVSTAYLTQGIQRLDHGVELVAGRAAYLRVFAVASTTNTAQPRVRVRLYHGGNEVATWLVNAPGSSVPLQVNESALANSWNVLIPGALVQPGLALLAEVDPDDLVPETNPDDNTFPVNGTPFPVVVRELLPFKLRLVPVLQSVNGNLGALTEANRDSYLTDMLTLLPIGEWEADVREPYTTAAPELQSNNANGAWGMILSEIRALRNTADSSVRYYYGVVQTSYSSGVAGIGYIGSPTGTHQAAVGWDRANSRASVLAHELGHNFGRYHAPCGTPAGIDQDYPHTNGGIGSWGLDLTTLSLKSPFDWKDLMGYCTNEWISDYTWNAVMNFRSLSPTGAPPIMAAGRGVDDGLLVWGRIGPSGTVLEPAFRVPSAGRPLPASGPYRVEGRDASGALLFSHPFEAAEVADLPGGTERHFAFVLPVGASADRLADLRVTGPGIAVAQRRPPPGGPRPVRDPQATRSAAAQRRLTWDAGAHPMAMVRNAATGEILSFARGGEIVLRTTATELDIQLSDGVRVERRRVFVQ